MNKRDAALLETLDALALSLPKGFVWPLELRRMYERACRLLQKRKK